MELSTIMIYFLAYIVPSFFFVVMITTILTRNTRSEVHVSLTLIMFFYMQLFIAEFVRNLSSVENSQYISSVWFSNAGVLVTIFYKA